VSTSEKRIIPIFPLPLVLFPGMVIPLKLFEPRYRQLFFDINQSDKQFGILYVSDPDTSEVGDYPKIGTLTEISGHEILPNGQILIISVGLRRFRLVDVYQNKAYQEALVEIIEEEEAPAPTDDLVNAAEDTLRLYVSRLTALTPMSLSIPSDGFSPLDMSFFMASVLQVETDRKQQILMVDDLSERLILLLEQMNRKSEELGELLGQENDKGDYFYHGKRLSSN
jgi:Lon protease-like protein